MSEDKELTINQEGLNEVADEELQSPPPTANIEDITKTISADPVLVFLVQHINSLITRLTQQQETIGMLHQALQQQQIQIKQLSQSMEGVSGVLTMNCKEIEMLKGTDGDVVQYNH